MAPPQQIPAPSSKHVIKKVRIKFVSLTATRLAFHRRPPQPSPPQPNAPANLAPAISASPDLPESAPLHSADPPIHNSSQSPAAIPSNREFPSAALPANAATAESSAHSQKASPPAPKSASSRSS